MTTEYQNFLKMTKPFPTEPDWAVAGHYSQLHSGNDPRSRGENKRNAMMNLSQDLLNNFVSRNDNHMPSVGSPNSRYGVRQLEPINHPGTVLSRGT